VARQRWESAKYSAASGTKASAIVPTPPAGGGQREPDGEQGGDRTGHDHKGREQRVARSPQRCAEHNRAAHPGHGPDQVPRQPAAEQTEHVPGDRVERQNKRAQGGKHQTADRLLPAESPPAQVESTL
jgi:hypothetical protein